MMRTLNPNKCITKGIRLRTPLLLLFAVFLAAGTFVACENKKELNERTVLSELRYHLENNPVYETATLEYGEMRFRKTADAEALSMYEQLESYGYVHLELLKERKRFLSKDSTVFYIVQLTDKSIPYVLDKGPSKATVKTYEYKLDESQPVHIERSGKNRAKATVTLKQEETDFVLLAKKNQTPHATFIKRTYDFRFDEENGWRVIK